MHARFTRFLDHCVALLIMALFIGQAARVGAQSAYPQRTDPIVNDFAGILSAADRAELEKVHTELISTRGAELVIVTIGSISDYDVPAQNIEEFATGLFNSWGIGDRTRNDGVLLLVAVRDRNVRIEVGRSYGSGYNNAMQQVIDTAILPAFRASSYGTGIVAGAQGIQEALAAPPSNRSAYVPLAIGGVAVAAVAAGSAVLLRRRRKRERCPSCKARMRLAPAHQTAQYLSPGQQVEVRVKARRYNVWVCKRCGNSKSVTTYRSTELERCPSCQFQTLYHTTSLQAGKKPKSPMRQRIERHCHNCGFHDHRTETLPQRAHVSGFAAAQSADTSSYSASSSYDSSSSSSYDYSSSSSYDSGSSSSFDAGGSSAGDGASGSW